jgi:hypothetical protein
VREGYGKKNTKYACVGYCFGAPYVCDELAGDNVAVGAFAHPAFLKERHFTNLKSKNLMHTKAHPADKAVNSRAPIPVMFGNRSHIRCRIETKSPRYHAERAQDLPLSTLRWCRAWIRIAW